MKRKITLTFALLLLALLFVGCTKQRQLHDRLIVEGIGIDQEQSVFKATVHLFDADVSEDMGEGKVKTIESEGKSVLQALSNISNQTGEEPLYSQTFILLIGEQAAKNGVGNILDFFVRHYEARPYISIFIVKGSASEALNAKAGGEPIKAGDIGDLAKSDPLDSRFIGSNILKFVGDMQNSSADPKALALKLENKGEDTKIEIDGMAVFSGDKLSGFLNLDETLGVLLLRYGVKNSTLVVPIKDIGNVSFTITSSKSKTKVSIQNNLPIFDISINVTANIYQMDMDKESAAHLPPDSLALLQDALQEKLREVTKATIDKLVFECNSDVLYSGQKILKAKPSYFKSIKNDWKKLMKEAKYNLTIKADIQRTGQEII